MEEEREMDEWKKKEKWMNGRRGMDEWQEREKKEGTLVS